MALHGLNIMPLRTLLRFLADEHLIERLANSYPIRRLAQLTHYTYRRLTLYGNDALDKAVKSNAAKQASESYPQAKGRLVSFTRNFWRNIQNEIEKSQRGQR